ncbi:hypothetical protein NK6_4913 [Bradyrhizobium diazoefficiens]|uniref:Uncharacterized protein n=1 Tax=Bradyrhizobium diazoefficiens TaxID=1355477 RepID=A0A0E4BR42_9BRAD|nr:hypothetical protein NK6_4913 [Bradyrhizobium diazoefficiens]
MEVAKRSEVEILVFILVFAHAANETDGLLKLRRYTSQEHS